MIILYYKFTDFQFYILGGLNLIIICFKEVTNILGYEKIKDTYG